jgi:hypothetical protein
MIQGAFTLPQGDIMWLYWYAPPVVSALLSRAITLFISRAATRPERK